MFWVILGYPVPSILVFSSACFGRELLEYVAKVVKGHFLFLSHKYQCQSTEGNVDSNTFEYNADVT